MVVYIVTRNGSTLHGIKSMLGDDMVVLPRLGKGRYLDEGGCVRFCPFTSARGFLGRVLNVIMWSYLSPI